MCLRASSEPKSASDKVKIGPKWVKIEQIRPKCHENCLTHSLLHIKSNMLRLKPENMSLLTRLAPLLGRIRYAHCTAQMYACWLSGWLRCNFWTAFILSGRLYIYIWPVKINENVGLIKLTGVEWIITADSIYLLLRRTDAPQWVALRRELTQLTLCIAVKWRNAQSCLRWR